eukprot:3183369-Amphidinium_carterae.2
MACKHATPYNYDRMTKWSTKRMVVSNTHKAASPPPEVIKKGMQDGQLGPVQTLLKSLKTVGPIGDKQRWSYYNNAKCWSKLTPGRELARVASLVEPLWHSHQAGLAAGVRLLAKGWSEAAGFVCSSVVSVMESTCHSLVLLYGMGYAMMLINMDGKDELRNIFGPAPFTTLFMIKKVGVSKAGLSDA